MTDGGLRIADCRNQRSEVRNRRSEIGNDGIEKGAILRKAPQFIVVERDDDTTCTPSSSDNSTFSKVSNKRLEMASNYYLSNNLRNLRASK